MITRLLQRPTACLAAAVLAIVTASSVQAALPEVLKQVPGDAYGVAVISNTRSFATRISNAATRLDIPVPPDLVGWATRNIGITEGFDVDGSTALVLLKPSAAREAQGYFSEVPPAVLLLPTVDSKAMLAPFSPADPDAQGISELSLPANPDEKGFVAVVDNKWVALAQNRDDLVAYLGRGRSFADTAGPDTLKVFDVNDLVLRGNIEKLGVGADKWLDDGQTELGGMLELANIAQNQDAFATAIQKGYIDIMFDFARRFMVDTSAGMLTLRMTDSGVTLGVTGDFKADSPIGKFVAGQAAAEPVSFKGLAAGNFLAAGAIRWNGPLVGELVGKLGEQLTANPAVTADPRVVDFRKSFELSKQAMEITQAMRFILLDPPAGGNSGFFHGAVLCDTPDPQKYVDLSLQSAQSQVAQVTSPDLIQSTTVARNAITIKDVRFHRINMNFKLREQTPDRPIDPNMMATLPVLQRIMGPQGMTMYMGIVGPRVLVIYGSDNATLESAVTAALAESEDLATHPLIQAGKDQLVANPIMVAYLPVARWLLLAQSMIRPPAPGDPAPAATIINAPPVLLSAGVSGKTMTAEIHVPVSTILGIQEGVNALQRTTEGGQGGGDPGGLPNP